MRAGSPWGRMLAGAALAALPALSGCVAVAIPVVAAGTIVGKQATGNHPDVRPDGPRVALPAEPAALPGPSPTAGEPAARITRSEEYRDGSRIEVSMPARRQAGFASPADAAAEPMTAAAPPPQVADAARPAAPAAPASIALADGTRVTRVDGPLPPPGASAPAGAAALPGAAVVSSTGDYAAFVDFADAQGSLPVVGSERRSAMLVAPGTLDPRTRNCSVQPAAVMIDLDPAGATLDPLRSVGADPALAAALADLRAHDILIAWVSSVTADRAGAVRKALVSSGLDPAGEDELVLLRFPEERKQTRREDLAKELCVVAISGDERADFDELFQYLKDPGTAAALEPLIGNGWFLIPTPLS